MKTPITQSREWQKLQNDLQKASFFESKDGYQYLAVKHRTPVGNYLFVPYGPLAEDEKSFKKALKSLEDLAKSEKAIFIRIEPENPAYAKFLPSNAKKAKDIDPADTWVLDLTPEKSELISNFSQGTRTRYNNYAKKGLTVEITRETSEIKHLVALQRKLFEKKHLTAYDENYLKRELEQPFATLYLVKYNKSNDQTRMPKDEATKYPKNGQILAASLFFDHNDTRYYMQSAADQDYKRLPATVALLTSAIMDAKDQGIKRFDFWGIAPEGADHTHPWYGFTEFKKSFGGEEVHYAGTYDLPINTFKYQVYCFLKKLKGQKS